jgi:adenylate cyclase
VVAGGVAALLGVLLAGAIARGLAGPIQALVAAAGRVRGGDYTVAVATRGRDELARLAAAFNDMVQGLAQRDRYRRLLDLVADREVAARLVAGEVQLGGELRRVSVVFCDICGFTALTNALPPTELVAVLNAHMDALTRVVHAHGGVVDKFIGDAVMAVFGAPAATGDEAGRAVAAARAMVAERARLNRQTDRPLQVRVGVATGEAVVGCMGATHRLDYTVVGAHVNLAARLCALAAAGEVLIDEATRAEAHMGERLEALSPAVVKGFEAPVQAYRLSA